MAHDVQIEWEHIQAKIADACGTDKKKLALAEILCLHQFAVNTLRATMIAPNAKKSKLRKRLTR